MRGIRWNALTATGTVLLVIMFIRFDQHQIGSGNGDLGFKNQESKILHNDRQPIGIRGLEKTKTMKTNSLPLNKSLLQRNSSIPSRGSASVEAAGKNQGVINVQEYISLLEKKVSKDKTIIISTVDYSFVDMAINFYKTSIQKWDLTNFLFLCSHGKAKDTLTNHGIEAVQLWNDTDGAYPSDFATPAFNRKTQYKTMAATLALDHGYTVVVVDVDIVFLKNPIPYLTCDDCELIIQSEGSKYYRNTGFYLAFPTKNTMKLHHMVLNTFKSMTALNDQQAFNGVLLFLESQGGFKVKVLGLESFPNGDYYFDKGERMFADDNPCANCVLVHNNFIAAYSNKRYRFREHLLWTLDDDQYYSDPKAKYLMYENSFDFGAKYTLEMEEKALETAFMLGVILKRIVILPKFHCYECPQPICKKKHLTPRCDMHVHYNMTAVDQVFENKYRENMFLQNKLVPNSIKTSVSLRIFIKSKATSQPHISQHLDMKDVKKTFVPSNIEIGATREEFVDWLKPFEQYSILNFHSLYGKILSMEDVMDINYLITTGLKSFHKR